ncbi:hypothetical protein BD626DRAFT_431490 [Schizophyllum amplum]|uniref:Protein farnesyltransferase/geranylgeranyltransferase type-1 subunit alpha n=1 Tax=Schizophyllum amplum TaxID=97359 RepID=A0A550CFR0_9AGAR|nr:hypothetical protein BD626DRAFT_431490 [Auriculariopsis ampla]
MPSLPDDILLYSQRQEWSDVQPLEQYEGVNPLAPIFYTDEYKDATNYFRGIVKTGEKSERVLELTEDIIRQNPAHYSAWQYRYETLIALGAPLDKELKLMEGFAIKYMKTYQIWHHRRLLLMKTRNPEPELQLIAKILQVDSKNYHTWSHRQWLLAHFNQDALWAGELDFVQEMLNADLRNNSAWHHRFFVVFQSGIRDGEEDRDRVVKRELTYVKQNISLIPNNMSAWNYLRGILDFNKLPYSTLTSFVQLYTHKRENGGDVVDLDNPPPDANADLPCPMAIEFMADVYEAEGGESTPKAVELWKSLAEEHDAIRRKYWEFRCQELGIAQS